MPLLTPTVHERLARCGETVTLSGLVSGADVEVDVGGTTHTFVAGGGVHHLAVAPLGADDVVRARQDDGSGPTPWSAEVIVEDAAVPPVSPPLLPSQVGACSQCVHVSGLVPGCEVRLEQHGVVVGSGIANRGGAACVGVALRITGTPEDTLTARMIVCGVEGPAAQTPVVADAPLGEPLVGDPLFGCQSVVPLGGLRPGAKTRIETDTGTYLGWICNCADAVNVNVLHALVPGERVHAQQFWDGDTCSDAGPWGGWRLVENPDERIKPEVEAPLVEGDQVIHVTNQIVGSDLVILLRPNADTAATRFGPRPASAEEEISLNAPLVAGHQVAVEQRLCGHVETSDWVTVLPAPPEVLAPIVLPPLYECGGAVQVAGLHPGAFVRVYCDGFVCGLGWAGLAWSIAVDTQALMAGTQVTARQWVGGVAGSESDPVDVLPLESPHVPRIVEPLAWGDTSVLVSGVSPGALVTVRAGATVLGEQRAAESLIRIAVSPVPDRAVHAVSRFCDTDRAGPTADPIWSPSAQGPEDGVGWRDVDYGTFTVPVHAVPDGAPDDGGFESPIRGRLYFPADDQGELAFGARGRPLVVVAHGMWYSDEQDQSHLGYAWLARHLARWGMFVLSVDLGAVNLAIFPGLPKQQWSRGEVMLAAASAVIADPEVQGRIDPDRVGLVGHSMSGEGVVAASVLSPAHAPPLRVRGVVSIAPTNHRPDLCLTDCHYLQLHGSLDYLLDGFLLFNGFRVFDRAWRHRTHVWVDGGRHQGWNPNWWNSPTGEGGWDPIEGSLTPEQHAVIGRAYINAFFQDVLFDRHEYRGYLAGLVPPRGLAGYEISVQHHPTVADVWDDMGDAERALGLLAEAPTDKSTNRRGGPVQATGSGVDEWDDLDQSTLPDSAHSTRAVALAWHERDLTYRSVANALASTATGELALRVAVRNDPAEAWNLAGLDLDLLVEVETAGGTATVRAGAARRIPYPYPGTAWPTVPVTVRLPLDAFSAMTPGFNPAAITAVTVRPAGGTSGSILIDDVEVAQ